MTLLSSVSDPGETGRSTWFAEDPLTRLPSQPECSSLRSKKALPVTLLGADRVAYVGDVSPSSTIGDGRRRPEEPGIDPACGLRRYTQPINYFVFCDHKLRPLLELPAGRADTHLNVRLPVASRWRLAAIHLARTGAESEWIQATERE